MHHLIFGINFQIHFVSLTATPIGLFLVYFLVKCLFGSAWLVEYTI